VRELQDLRRGRVTIGANEAGVHTLLPIVERFRAAHPQVLVDVRRVPARQIGAEVLEGSLDFGILTFAPAERGLASIVLGADELVLLTHPSHPLAHRRHVGLEELGRQTIIAHNDPSPARERVLQLFEQRHAPLDIRVSLPSLDGIKRAVPQIGVPAAAPLRLPRSRGGSWPRSGARTRRASARSTGWAVLSPAEA
jgi:DNA-binding transcriptional LysR family regulator